MGALKWLVLAPLLALLVLHKQFRFFDPERAVFTEGWVVVTGASSGLGKATALDILTSTSVSPGVRVLATVRSEKDVAELRAAAREKNINDKRLHISRVDVTDRAAVKSLVDAFLTSNERVFGLVNNAGVSHTKKLADMDETSLGHLLNVNVNSLILTTRDFLPLLVRTGSGARVVNIGSMSGYFARPGATAYTASKFAVEGVSDALRMELGVLHNISVSIVEPGFVISAMCSNPAVCVDQPDVVTTAVIDALFHPRPLPRYPVAGIGLTRAWVGVYLSWFPDRLKDALITQNVKPTRV